MSLDEVAAWLRESRSTVALTGAGVSTESGIPDFRGPNGIWTRDPASERLSNIGYYIANPEIRRVTDSLRLPRPVLQSHLKRRSSIRITERDEHPAPMDRVSDGRGSPVRLRIQRPVQDDVIHDGSHEPFVRRPQMTEQS